MHRRPTAVAILLAAALALSACSGDDDPSASPSTGGDATSGATAGTTSDAPSASSSADGSADAEATPGVDPATGPVLKRDRITLRAPDGWRKVPNAFGNQAQAQPKEFMFGVDMILSSISGSSTADLDDLERATVQSTTDRSKTRRQPRRVVDGVEVAHVVAPGVFGREDIFITLYDQQQVSITFNTPEDMRQKRRDAIIEPVLASVEWQ
ncbi:hypothetical protein [Nocardioides abyssi]|uniref:Lipoprotein n=1 Tax=Nocardioides abyssi TaxID=3058370 RepID=A0ABT8ER87_9ACTN|nr:hypothetical protein [Nocardioides abyssi]MDN4160431.1 hypothetical protein [Nocardioides abyssi]